MRSLDPPSDCAVQFTVRSRTEICSLLSGSSLPTPATPRQATSSGTTLCILVTVWQARHGLGAIGKLNPTLPHKYKIIQPLARSSHTSLSPVNMTPKIGYAEVFLLLFCLFFLYRYWTRDPRRAHLPPHVRGWPLINQTLDQVKDNPIPLVLKWGREYGELCRTTSGTTMFIWVNSRKAFKELIDRRSAIYSSRHPQPMVNKASGGKRMVFMPYGKDWRSLRNIIHRVRSDDF